MIRGTTPPITITVLEELGLENTDTAFLTFEQNGENVLEKTLEDISIDNNSFICQLSQQETLAFSVGQLYFQLRFRIAGQAYATPKFIETVYDVIKDGVI